MPRLRSGRFFDWGEGLGFGKFVGSDFCLSLGLVLAEKVLFFVHFAVGEVDDFKQGLSFPFGEVGISSNDVV